MFDMGLDSVFGEHVGLVSFLSRMGVDIILCLQGFQGKRVVFKTPCAIKETSAMSA
jgi:hypothetical protein